jgi:hypothetical protein
MKKSKVITLTIPARFIPYIPPALRATASSTPLAPDTIQDMQPPTQSALMKTRTRSGAIAGAMKTRKRARKEDKDDDENEERRKMPKLPRHVATPAMVPQGEMAFASANDATSPG